MIVNKYANGGGGSTSGVTPEQVQQQINSALTPYWDSAATEDAISAATSGKADAANVSGRSTGYYFPYYNEQGVITGDTQAYKETLTIHLSDRTTASANLFKDNNYGIPEIYVASKPGTAGQIAKSNGKGFTWADDIYTPTSGFSTINGSAITNGGNIVIEGGADMSAYYTSAQTEDAITSKNYITSAQVETQIVSKNYITSAEIADFVTSAQVETQIEAKNYVNSGDVKTQIEAYHYISGVDLSDYWTAAETQEAINQAALSGQVDMNAYYTSAQTDAAIAQAVSGLATEQYVQDALSGVNMDNYYTSAQTEEAITSKNYVTSAQVETQMVAKNYVNSGDVKSQVEAYNYATVSQIPTVPTSNTAFTNDAGYITDAAIENLVTSAQVETQIDTKAAAYTPTSGFSTINGSAITNGGDIIIQGGADMSAYYTSAQTEEAISAATAGKADAANVTANTNKYYFPKWNSQGVITGITGGEFYLRNIKINGTDKSFPCYDFTGSLPAIYAPTTSGNPGEFLVADGTNTPKWSAVTFPDVSNYVTSAQVETQIVEKNYATSAQVETQITSKGYATVSQIPTVPTSNTAFTNDAGYVTSAQVETQIVEKNYITSAAIANMVTSTYVSTIWRGTQSDYDAIVDKDPNTFYIIVSN